MNAVQHQDRKADPGGTLKPNSEIAAGDDGAWGDVDGGGGEVAGPVGAGAEDDGAFAEGGGFDAAVDLDAFTDVDAADLEPGLLFDDEQTRGFEGLGAVEAVDDEILEADALVAVRARQGDGVHAGLEDAATVIAGCGAERLGGKRLHPWSREDQGVRVHTCWSDGLLSRGSGERSGGGGDFAVDGGLALAHRGELGLKARERGVDGLGRGGDRGTRGGCGCLAGLRVGDLELGGFGSDPAVADKGSTLGNAEGSRGEVATDDGLGVELDALACAHVAFDGAVDDDACSIEGGVALAGFADVEIAARGDAALHRTEDAGGGVEGDLTLDVGAGADDGGVGGVAHRG